MNLKYTLLASILLYISAIHSMDTSADVSEAIKEFIEYCPRRDQAHILEAITHRWLNPEQLSQQAIEGIKKNFCLKYGPVKLFENNHDALEPLVGNWDQPVKCLGQIDQEYTLVGGEFGGLGLFNHKTATYIKLDKIHRRGRIIALLPLDSNTFIVAEKFGTLSLWNTEGVCLKQSKRLPSEIEDAIILNDGSLAIAAGYKIYLMDSLLEHYSVLEGHTHFVQSVIQLPNNLLASGSMDKTLRIWDIRTGECIRVLEGHTGMILRLAALPNGTIVSTGWDNTVRIWDTEIDDCIHTIKFQESRQLAYIYDLKVLPDNKIILACDENIGVIDGVTGTVLAILKGHKDLVYSLGIISDSLIASCATDGTIKIWDLNSLSCVNTIPFIATSLWKLSITAEKSIVVGDSEGALYTYRPGISFEDIVLYLKRIAPIS